METSFSDIETVRLADIPPWWTTHLTRRLPQRFVLGEMIKASSIDVHLLVDFIKNNNVEQNWMYMQLPVGKWSHVVSS